MISFSLQKKLHAAEGEVLLHAACELPKGSFTSLYGSSGAGKTSILRMLAGLLKPDSGFIKVDGEFWFNRQHGIDLVPQQRKIGLVFQDYALFPNLSVRENIAFPLVKNDPRDIVDELLELTGLSLLAGRKIQTLSGGQQQRVALARAIARKPRLLLLDEPLSAVGNAMREQLQDTLLALHKRYGLTTILVSHDIREIVRLSDKILSLETGELQEFNAAAAFLGSLGHFEGLAGTILSSEKNGSVNNIVLFVRNTVFNTSIPANGHIVFQKGEQVRVEFGKDASPAIHKL